MTISFLDPPRELAELNSCLDECIANKSLASLLELTNWPQAELPLELFCDLVHYPLQSYQDREGEILEAFRQKVVTLFPHMTTRERGIFARTLAGTSTSYSGIKELTKRIMGGVERFDPICLQDIAEQVEQSPTERLHAICTQGLDVLKKAQYLQEILSYLSYERNLIHYCWEEIRAGLKAGERYADYTKGATSTIRLTAMTEVVFFPCPEAFDSPEALACFTQSRGILQKCVQAIEAIDFEEFSTTAPFRMIYNRLKGLAQDSGQVKELVDRIFSYIDFQLLSIQSLRINQKFLRKGASMIGFELTAESGMTPYANKLLELMVLEVGNELAVRSEGNLIERRDPEYYSAREQICQAYVKHFKYQQAFYAQTYQELQKLINAQRRKIQWMGYTKNLDPFAKEGATFLEQLEPLALADPTLFIDRILTEPRDQQLVQQSFLPPALLHPKQPRRMPHRAAKSHSRGSSQKPRLSQVEKLPEAPPSKSLSVFQYAKRVTRWFKESLSEKDFPEYSLTETSYIRRMQAFHGFSLEVDRFHTIGLQRPWTNSKTGHSDTQYILPARLSFEGKIVSGTIVYCIGKDGKCYHRFFNEMKETKMAEAVVAAAFKDADFPPLGVDPNDSFSPIETTTGDEVSTHPLLGIVTIQDARNNTTIQLFPVESRF